VKLEYIIMEYNMKPLVSIIIPNYNQEKYIEETMATVLAQTYENIEVIVTDDGSTDNSLTLLREIEKKDCRVKILTQENMNASVARNLAISKAQGEFFLFMDSDDTMYPNGVEVLVEAQQEFDADLVVGNMDEFINDHEITAVDEFFKERGVGEKFTDFLDILPAVPNKLYKASIVKEKHVIFGNVRIGQDTNFFLKYLCCCKRIAYIPDIIFSWRLIPTSVTHAMDFHIFDITNSFANTKKFYIRNGFEREYMDYIRMFEFHTYYGQMDKQRKFKTRQERLLVANYFDYHLKQLGDMKTCPDYEKYKGMIKKCHMKQRMKWLYTTKLFAAFYNYKNRNII